MKHFSSQTGGRHTYVDDVMNLQELALAINAIFDGCDNFIVSGCEVAGNTVSPGIIYLNKELRYFSGTSGIATWPLYINEANSFESVEYATGSQKVGRTIYGCSVSQVAPTNIDTVTGKVPEYIIITENGGKTIKDAFFGRYAILSNPSASLQEIQSKLNLLKETYFNSDVEFKAGFSLPGGGRGRMFQENDQLVIQYRSKAGAECRLAMSDTNLLSMTKDGEDIFNISDTFSSSLPFKVPSIAVGRMMFKENGITSSSDSLEINVTGPDGNTNYINTVIGDGKGNSIITVFAERSEVKVDGSLTLDSQDNYGLILKSKSTKDDNALVKSIAWQDKDAILMAEIGFISNANKEFCIKSSVGSINITAVDSVNIGPAIRENGILLSEKYCLVANMAIELANYAKKADVYTKGEINSGYAKLSSGLTQFVNSVNTVQKLRESIGATDLSTVKSTCPTLSNCLSDMATTEGLKARIRENIGAAAIGSFHPKMKDTGWITIISGLLYARQIGDIVSIQGKIVTKKRDTEMFTLPSSIDPPRHSVSFSSEAYNWAGYISGGSKKCYSYRCGNANETIYFALTYMT